MTPSDKLLQVGLKAVSVVAFSAAVMSLFGIARVQISVTRRPDAELMRAQVHEIVRELVDEGRLRRSSSGSGSGDGAAPALGRQWNI